MICVSASLKIHFSAMEKKSVSVPWMVLAILSAISLWGSTLVWAHCDTLDGPVVQAAKKALEKGDITPVLKWVKKENEAEVRDTFQKTPTVRGKGPEAQELADRYFFESLVCIHRAGEGAPIRVFLWNPWNPSLPLPIKHWRGDRWKAL